MAKNETNGTARQVGHALVETQAPGMDSAQLLQALCERIAKDVTLDRDFENALQAAIRFGIVSKEDAANRRTAALREKRETILRETVTALAQAVFGDGIALYGLVLRDATGKVVVEIVAPDWNAYRTVVTVVDGKGKSKSSTTSNKRNKSNYTPEFVALAQQVCARYGNTWFGISSFVRSGRMFEDALKEAVSKGIPIYLPEDATTKPEDAKPEDATKPEDTDSN